MSKTKQTFLHDFFRVTSTQNPKRKSNSPSLQSPQKVKPSPKRTRKSRTLNMSQENEESPPWQLATQAQENILMAMQCKEPVQFNLEAIYREKRFHFDFDISDVPTRDEIKNIHPPQDKHADRLFQTIVLVFKDPVNCAYFDKNELNTILSILRLSATSLTILARFLKWKPGWHRVEKAATSIGMDRQDLSQANDLFDARIFDNDLENERMSVILDILPLDEVRMVAKAMKVRHMQSKPQLINKLLVIAGQTKSFFPGVTTPSEALRKAVKSAAGPCVRVSELTWMLIKKIITLHYPNHDYEDTLSDIFRTLMDVYFNTRNYPETPKERFPLFRNREVFSEYMEAKQKLTDTIEALINKEWDMARSLGSYAHDRLKVLLSSNVEERDFELPDHLLRFTASHVLSKIIWKSIDAFKKNNMEGITSAKEFLMTLISQKRYPPGYRGRYYAGLALIESNYFKDLDASADLTQKALQEDLSPLEIAEMLERARKLARRKTGISAERREAMEKLIYEREEEFVCSPKENVIEAQMMDHEIAQRTKSVWQLETGEEEKAFGEVEIVAMEHYIRNGYTRGLHCEGRLPVTLFACLLWNEIYTAPVPGAFVSDYMVAPLDLWTKTFYQNRRELIEERISFARNVDIETLSEILHSNYIDYQPYTSLINKNLFEDSEHLKDIVCCLGTDAVIGICESMIHNYRQMSAGFPDLIVWNREQLTCRVVEVKGPGDSLSVKQKMWIKRLQELYVDIEVCLVKTK